MSEGLLLPEGLQAPSVARDHVRCVGAAWADQLLEVVVLLTSEVVTNAVVHGHPPVRLAVRTHDAATEIPRAGSTSQTPGTTAMNPAASADTGAVVVRVEVRDDGVHLAPDALAQAAAAMPALQATGGRGLPLLHLLAQRWGGHREYDAGHHDDSCGFDGPADRTDDPRHERNGNLASTHLVWFEVVGALRPR